MQPEWLKTDSSITRGIWVVLLMCLTVLLLANCRRITTHALNLPTLFGSFERHASISYAPGERGLLDVYAPREAKHRPVVVFWYGGSWVEGSREDYRFVGAALARAGYVAVLPTIVCTLRFPSLDSWKTARARSGGSTNTLRSLAEIQKRFL